MLFFFFFSQDEPAGRILELSILHLAMSEITVLGTRHQIVINEVSAFFDLFEILLMHSDISCTQTLKSLVLTTVRTSYPLMW